MSYKNFNNENDLKEFESPSYTVRILKANKTKSEFFYSSSFKPKEILKMLKERFKNCEFKIKRN